MTTYPWATRCPIFSWFEATFWIASLRFTSLHFTSLQFNQVGKGSTHWGAPAPPKPPRRGRAHYTFRRPADVETDLGISVISEISGKSREKARVLSTSNRSKPICVLTRTKSLYMLDSLPIGYHLPDFQLIWSNFKIEIFQLQTALNP